MQDCRIIFLVASGSEKQMKVFVVSVHCKYNWRARFANHGLLESSGANKNYTGPKIFE